MYAYSEYNHSKVSWTTCCVCFPSK